ncbi:RING-H2 finger protein ATL67-like [Ipomoea triloba]|uniref:RING-H2 finger protein ATL67-like n=1 Tax=Ipomoea triloba TaxID=35885 RepID=UPI00125E1EE4|nr:RING-H2 finger protein ATL67-like [Ipomoea triloba]GLL34391.1 RING-H2 finger protein ATL67-like [Ipomoea trifida]GMD33243.1 RING-H2 finger protein ATL67-like [Ipomoea batatas]
MTIPSFYAAAPPPPPPPLTSANKPNSVSTNFTTIGLGYAIAIAFGFLVLFSTVLLASYICCRSIAARRRRRRLDAEAGYRNSHPDDNGVYLPRIIFVAEDDEENDGVSGQNVALGLDQAVINSYPKLVYSKRSGNPGNDTLCSICLCEYKDSEMLRMLPDCKHYFHVTCIDAWLKLNASCPVCRNSPLPTPLSTPLSEVVPLSQYSDGRRRQ